MRLHDEEGAAGYECPIHNGYVNGDRSQPKDCGTGGIFSRQNARWVVADDQQWFHKTMIVHGPHMVEAGTIMIQGHDPTTDLSFRNLRITEMAPRLAE